MKRRIVSAMARHEKLEKHPDAADVTALSPEDVALLANEEARKLITDSEYEFLRAEFEEIDCFTM